jgi:signal-transduction protein with cAMP-binding, CBS, and nucleotidyltransferase domain
MPLIPDIAVFQRKLATLPLASYQAGETVLSAASTTGQLLILKEGKVAVVRQPVQRHHHARRGSSVGFEFRPAPQRLQTRKQ